MLIDPWGWPLTRYLWFHSQWTTLLCQCIPLPFALTFTDADSCQHHDGQSYQIYSIEKESHSCMHAVSPSSTTHWPQSHLSFHMLHMQILQKDLYNHCAAPIFLQWKLNTSIEDNFSFQYDEFHQLPPPGSSLGWVSIHTLHTYVYMSIILGKLLLCKMCVLSFLWHSRKQQQKEGGSSYVVG